MAGYGFSLTPTAQLRLTSGFNRTKTTVTKLQPTPGVLAAFSATLFDRVERTRIEKGQPKDNFNLSGILTYTNWVVNARTQRFGKVTLFGTPTTGSLDQTFSAKYVTDASVSYSYKRTLTFMVGADNIFDVYPDINNNNGPIATDPNTSSGGNSNFGIFPYNAISPFGFNGRYAYVRVTWNY